MPGARGQGIVDEIAMVYADLHRLTPPMATASDLIGKTYKPVTYAVGREKIREYASAVGEASPLHFDLEAARAAGYPDLVAPPMFAVVYSLAAVAPAIIDPAVGINFAMMVHASQEFEWGPLVVAGDEITTTASLKDITERRAMTFYAFETASESQRGERVCTGTWTQFVRAPL